MLEHRVTIGFGRAVWFSRASRAGEFRDAGETRRASHDGRVDHRNAEKPLTPTSGDDAAKVYIVEFTDPACETCAAFSDFVKQFMAAYPGKIKLVIRYAPFHHGSSDVVKVLVAAKKQGKFWETLDVLYASQAQWTEHHQVIVDRVWPILERAGLDVSAIRAGMNDPDINRIIEQDLADAQVLGVRKTPGLFVNGKPLDPFGAQEFRELVESELRANYPEAPR